MLLQKPANATIHVQVQRNDRYGVNDVRYFFFERLVQQNREWKYIFIVPCRHLFMNFIRFLQFCSWLAFGLLFFCSAGTVTYHAHGTG